MRTAECLDARLLGCTTKRETKPDAVATRAADTRRAKQRMVDDDYTRETLGNAREEVPCLCIPGKKKPLKRQKNVKKALIQL